jgi:hypothetical protein
MPSWRNLRGRCLGQPSRAILLLQMFTTRMAAGRGPSFAVEKRTPVDEFPSITPSAPPPTLVGQ